ncbi:carboxypeptidase regulatory-like domain-containing protein [bacterium]|nr:carboxypeptidase regulatory-like domain-containing protein [bacterium]
MKRLIAKAGLISMLLALGSPLIAADLINIGLIASSENEEQDLVLQQVPLNITEASDTLVIEWSPATTGVFRYAQGSPGNNLDAYSVLNNPLNSSPGHLEILASRLPVGQLTCIITSQDGVDRSAYFQVLRASAFAPVPLSPITAAGGDGINTVTPTFTWQSVTGVPYYLIFVADQPFTIIQDDDGTRVEGANVVWQAITSGTSIQYGVQDPSGTIENEMVPPLVGSTDPDGRPRYNWTVLNSYGNSAEYTSGVVGTVAGFELEVSSPFAAPTLITPAGQAEVYDSEILFQWSSIPEATSYLVYLSRFELYSNGTEILFPVWRVQTTDNAVICPAASILQNERYNWKVIAANGQGYGSLSDSSSFSYNIESEEMRIRTMDTFGNPVDLVRVEFEAVDGPGLQPIATDDGGRYTNDFPLGTYILRASKQGYIDAESPVITLDGVGNGVSANLELEQQQSAFIGLVRNSSNSPVSGATVQAVSGGGTTFSATTNLSGEFHLPADPATYTLTASRSGYQESDPRTLNLGLGQSMDLADNGGPLILTPYTYTISGQVRNPAGQPINLAQVQVNKGSQTFSMYTGQAGQYSFTVGNGTWSLSASKPGFYLNSGPIAVQIADADVPRNITLNPQAAIISGFVYLGTSPSGASGLQVRAIPSSGEAVSVPPAANGSFSLGVAPGTYTLTAILTGYTAQPITMTLGPGQTSNGIQLQLTANPSAITGALRTSSGTPVPQAAVYSGDVSATTNASGVYSLNLPAGEHTLTAQKTGYSTAISGPWTLAAGQNLTNVNLTTSPNVATVTGAVSHGGAGIIGATITATPSTGSPITVSTGTGGTFNLGLQPGTYTLTAAKSGFVVLAPTSYSLNLQPGAQVGGRNFSMQPNIGTVIGTVTSASGPVYGALVTVRPSGSTSGGVQTSSSVTGSFNVSVEPGIAYQVIASKQGFNTATTTTSTIPLGGEVNSTITMSLLGSSVSGVVTSSEGSVLSGATIIASSGTNSYSTTSEAGGAYTISIPPGTYTIDISAAGHVGGTGSVTTTPGQNRSGVNWTLETNYALIAGSVSDDEGNGVPDAQVVLNRSSGGSRQATADAAGYFQFNQVLGGNYSAVASASAFASQTIAIGLVVDGQVVGTADFELEPLASGFSGTVTAGASPISDATVRATGEDGVNYTALSGADGTYTLSSIPSGTYTVEALKAGYTGSQLTGRTVNPGETATANLSLTANNGQITGLVTDSDDSPVSGVRVTAQAPTGHYAETNSTPTGTYTLNALFPATTYDLTFSKEGFANDSRSSISTGSNVQVELVRNSLTISGLTRNQANTILPSIPIRATNLEDGSILTATSNESGVYTLTEVAANTGYRIVTLYAQPNVLDEDTTYNTGTSNVSNVHLQLIQRTASVTGSVGTSGVLISAERTDGGSKSTYSEANGSYTLSGMRDGTWTLTPAKAGYQFSPATRTVTGLGVGEARTGVSFSASNTQVTVSGTVVDDGNLPMAETTVSLLAEGGSLQATTDENGDFIFTEVPGYTTYTLSAVVPAEGYQSSIESLEIETSNVSDIEVVVTISLGGLRGNVTNSSGVGLRPYYISLDGGDPEEVSRNEGMIVINNLLRGDHTAQFSRQGYTTVDESFTLEDGFDVDTLNVVMELIQGGFSFEIFHNYTGLDVPIRGVHLALENQNGETWEAFTNSLGLASISDLSMDDSFELSLSKLGYVPRTGLEVSLDNPNRDFLLVPQTNTIFGTVFDQENTPLENATVTLRNQEGTVRTSVTDAFGAYSLLRLDGPSTILAIDPDEGQTSYLHTFALPSGEYLSLDLTMRNAAEIHGTVETTGGDPPASRALIETENSTAGTFGFLRADTLGNYRIRGLRPGEFTVTLSASGYISPDPVELGIEAGTNVEQNWVIEAEATSIAGRVLRSDTEQGITHAVVDAVGPETYRAETEGDGDFGFVDIEPGAYTLTASRHGYVESEQEVTVASGDVAGATFTIQPTPNTVSGIYYDSDGTEPFEAGVIQLFDDTETLVANDTTDSLGRYSLELPDDGTYNLVPLEDTSPANREVMHEAGQGHPELDFTLVVTQGTATVTGNVTYRSTGVGNAAITIQQIAGTNQFETTTDQDGRYSQVVTAPARYRLQAFSDQHGFVSSAGFEIVVDTTITRDLAYASGQIGVTVIDEDDNPVPNNLVTISALDGSYTASFFTNAAGHAVTPGTLLNGSYSVSASATDSLLATAPIDVEITQGDSVGVQVPLGFAYTPPTVGNVGESLTVQVRVPDTYIFVSTLLYYRNVGENFFRTVQMVPAPSLSSTGIGSGQKESAPTLRTERVKRVRGADKLGRVIRSQSNGSNHKMPDGGDAVVIYEGEVPAQSGTGNLAFYPELITTTGLVIGGPSSTIEVEISNIGILSALQVTPGLEEVQPGVPVLFTVRALDAAGNNLTEAIEAANPFNWFAEEEIVVQEDSREAVYLAMEEGPDTISVSATQEVGGSPLTIRQLVPVSKLLRELGDLEIASPALEVASGDSLLMSAVAIDTGGVLMGIAADWGLDTTLVGSLAVVDYTQDAWFHARSGRIGQARITVEDSYTGVMSVMNDQNGGSSEGLGVYFPIVSGPDSTFEVEDGTGAVISGRFTAAAQTGQQGKLFLRRPQLAQLQRFYSDQEAVEESGYRLLLVGSLNEDVIIYRVTLPLKAGAADRSPEIARWNVSSLGWESLGGEIAEDGRSITTAIRADVESSSGIDGLYAVIVPAKPLAIEDLFFNPNPFSPRGDYPLSIEFTLHSLYPDVWVSIDLYNMVGQHVRSLLDRTPISKGRYARTGGDNAPIIWNGLTDDGLMARNGRYVVHIIAEDASGKKERIETVVLIK